MVTADLRESGCERGGRAAILVQYESIFLEAAVYLYSLHGTRRVRDYTNRCITQSWTGVRQYGQIFMLAEQRSHAS